MFEFLRPSKYYWLSLAVALTLAATLSSSQAGSSLIVDLSPEDGGTSTRASWSFGGDIVSFSGARFGNPSLSLQVQMIDFTFLVPEMFDSNFGTAGSGVPNAGRFDTYIPNSLYLGVIGRATVGSLSFFWSDAPFISLSFQPSLGVGGITPYRSLYYIGGTDTCLIPVAFSSFKTGSFTNPDSSWLFPDKLSTTVNVVPEPSTYVLFGFGALLLFVVNRRRKSRN